ncbi:iron (metal) dependent repressor, DtxR family [Spirochaeta thermophila DSM 6578]|uniref:Transcriptional regulator MntR n=1 Tax=Winmispira thermophila (strain ATCC 700085 / DSM 6578 / Z-1203) TaxID=869211 RepID=G0GA87_WINT7|nr:metal-dependent transcriptional regulator [Spirochaeta thermophila]AEJ60923.1 iron (metal) dependent repressor, DtxR family [Spirochaeta thermophila DSM 6578]
MRQEDLTSRMEDYLEAIYVLAKTKRVARVRDIAEALGVSRSTVSNTLHTLSDKGFIEYAPYDIISLTEEGEEAAKDVFRRHTILKRFFRLVLGAEEQMAEENACRIEHAISEELLERLVQYLEFIQECVPAPFRYDPEKGAFVCEDREDEDVSPPA